MSSSESLLPTTAIPAPFSNWVHAITDEVSELLAGGGGSSESLLGPAEAAGPGGPHDDEFNDGSIAAGWVPVLPGTPRGTWVEKYGRLNWIHDLSGGDARHALVRPYAMAVGDYIQTAVSISALNTGSAGLIVADGAVHGAGNQVIHAVNIPSFNNAATIAAASITNYGTSEGLATVFTGPTHNGFGGVIFLRLKLEATNTWGSYLSLDGMAWRAQTVSFGRTITPTHVGVFAKAGDTTSDIPRISAALHYFRVNEPAVY
jgi:hypothetical protein